MTDVAPCVRARLAGSQAVRAGHPSASPAIDHKMMQEQADDLMRREGLAAAVHAPDPIGIAIRDQAKVVWMSPKPSGGASRELPD